MSSQETVQERDFNSFYLEDDPLQLAHGLMPEIATAFGIDLYAQPSEEGLGTLVGLIAKNKILRDNEPVTVLSGPQMAGMLERSGVQLALNRTLWTPNSNIQDVPVDAVVITGAVANWQDRTANLLMEQVDPSVRIEYATSDSQMISPTDLVHPDVLRLKADLGRLPTESEYAASVIIPRLVKARFKVTPHNYESVTGDQLAEKLFSDNPHLADQTLVFARVPNAGIQLAVQMRNAARAIRPSFDTLPSDPQAFVLTGEFPVDHTADQSGDPTQFQKAQTGLRQAVLTAKLLLQAQR